MNYCYTFYKFHYHIITVEFLGNIITSEILIILINVAFIYLSAYIQFCEAIIQFHYYVYIKILKDLNYN